jgi:hypothetical protein
MKIIVKAKAGAREESLVKISPNYFEISVKALPVQGKANVAIAKVLAEHFQIPFLAVKLVSGFSSKIKSFEVINNAK